MVDIANHFPSYIAGFVIYNFENFSGGHTLEPEE